MTKKLLEYVEGRCNYIKGKLHSCKGYSREEKAIRLEELYQIREQIAFRNDEIEVEKRRLKEVNAKLQETLRKQYKCYSCGTCNGKEDYINMQRHCENAIKAVQKLNGEIDGLNEKLKEVSKLAKENADANEFCLQELEQKVETQDNTINNYREALTNILNCLIRNNYKKNSPICDTIWYETNCTLFDYIAFKCGIENLQEYERDVLNDTI